MKIVEVVVCGSWGEFSQRMQDDDDRFLAFVPIEEICLQLKVTPEKAAEMKAAAIERRKRK